MPVVTVPNRSASGEPVLSEGEQILFTQPNVSLYFNPDRSEGSGTLYVTNKYVFVICGYYAGVCAAIIQLH